MSQQIIGEITRIVILQIFKNIMMPKLGGKGNKKKEWIVVHPGEHIVYETKNPDKNVNGPYIKLFIKTKTDKKYILIGFSRKGLEENYKGKINIIDNAIP